MHHIGYEFGFQTYGDIMQILATTDSFNFTKRIAQFDENLRKERLQQLTTGHGANK